MNVAMKTDGVEEKDVGNELIVMFGSSSEK